eukprot:scaffold359_cov372-Pavlova_lutheri.AAC.1
MVPKKVEFRSLPLPGALSNKCTPLDRLNPVFTKRPVRPGWKGNPSLLCFPMDRKTSTDRIDNHPER